MQGSTFWIINALLESGFHYEDSLAIETITEKVHILIDNGLITSIVPATTPLDNQLPKKDAKSLLVLPSFLEKHCHLDKTLIGDSWRSCRQFSNRIARCNFEKNLLPTLATPTKERAEALLEGFIKCRINPCAYPY